MKQTSSIRISKDSIAKAKKSKEVTGINAGAFVEQAIDEKIDRLPSKQKKIIYSQLK